MLAGITVSSAVARRGRHFLLLPLPHSPDKIPETAVNMQTEKAMAAEMALFMFLFRLFVFAPVSLCQEEISLVIVNNCNESVWPALLGGAGHHSPGGGGFRLATGEEAVFPVPSGWSGRIWGRQGCCFDDNGRGFCDSGDCAGLLKCGGLAGAPPATMVEMTLGTAESALHYFDVSLVDGFNLPVAVVPVGGGASCGTAACEVDLNVCCPSRFEVRKGGKVVGCRSACQALKTDKYCCTGEFASPKKCRPTLFSTLFKSLCPKAYSFAFDDSSSLRTCRAPRYLVTFCPPR